MGRESVDGISASLCLCASQITKERKEGGGRKEERDNVVSLDEIGLRKHHLRVCYYFQK